MARAIFIFEKDDLHARFSVIDANHANKMIEQIQDAQISQPPKNQIINALQSFIQFPHIVECYVNITNVDEYYTIHSIYNETDIYW